MKMIMFKLLEGDRRTNMGYYIEMIDCNFFIKEKDRQDALNALKKLYLESKTDLD